MTSEQIDRLRKGLGSTATSTTQEDVTKLLDEREALLEALQLALSTHLHPFGSHTADACGMCEKFRAAIAKAES